MELIEAGCEGAVAALKGWLTELQALRFDNIGQYLADDLVVTCDLSWNGGQMDKQTFIALERHIEFCEINITKLIAIRMDRMVIVTSYATVRDRFVGDLGSGMPSSDAVTQALQGNMFGYASGWRETDGRWQCFSHHIFGQTRG